MIEVLVSLFIMTVALFPLSSNFFYSYKQTKKIYLKNEALEKITERMHAILSLPYVENFYLDDGKKEVEYAEGSGKSKAMKEILKSEESSQYSGIIYKFKLKIKIVPQTYLGYGASGGIVVNNSRNFVQLLFTATYKDTDDKEQIFTLCSRLGQRSMG
ncbi:hypothetical protein ACFL35_00875 [Candidatus Riflebacteria bacterium]